MNTRKHFEHFYIFMKFFVREGQTIATMIIVMNGNAFLQQLFLSLAFLYPCYLILLFYPTVCMSIFLASYYIYT